MSRGKCSQVRIILEFDPKTFKFSIDIQKKLNITPEEHELVLGMCADEATAFIVSRRSKQSESPEGRVESPSSVHTDRGLDSKPRN